MPSFILPRSVITANGNARLGIDDPVADRALHIVRRRECPYFRAVFELNDIIFPDLGDRRIRTVKHCQSCLVP